MKPGIYLNYSAELYHADPCEEPSLNYSTGKALITESAWHAYRQHPRLGGAGMAPSRGMDRGNIVHAILLGQSLQNLELIDSKDYRTNAAKAQRDAAQARGKYVMLQREYDDITANLDAIRANLREAEVDLTGPCEATVVWYSDGTLCRTRMDNVTSDFCHITDLKCAEDANPANLERHIHDMCYDLQAAIEIDAIETVQPELAGRITFADVFIEMEYPYFVVRVDHSESMLSVGRSKWQRAKRMWNECLSSGKWPGYPNRITAHATNWAMSREFGEIAR